MSSQDILKEYGYSQEVINTFNIYSKPVQKYIIEALKNKCKIVFNESSSTYINGIEHKNLTLISKTDNLYFKESVTSNSDSEVADGVFFNSLDQRFSIDINRIIETYGIPIWSTKWLEEKCLTCDVCGEKLNAVEDLHKHHFAGACCINCLPENLKDWENNKEFYTK